MAVTNAHCVYQHSLNTKIHKFTFAHTDNRAVDEYMVHLRQIIKDYHASGSDEPLLLLTDLRPDGLPPFSYALQEARKVFRELPAPPMRAAYIYNKSRFLTIILNFFRLLGLGSTREFFEGDKEIEAIDWLLQRDD